MTAFCDPNLLMRVRYSELTNYLLCRTKLGPLLIPEFRSLIRPNDFESVTGNHLCLPLEVLDR